MQRVTFVIAAMALLSLCTAELSFQPGSESIVMLASFGSAEATCYVVSSDSTPPTVASSSLFSASVSGGEAAEGMSRMYNYTITLTTRAGVGSTDLVVSSGSDSITGSVIVAGVVIFDSEGKVISGDDGEGATIGSSGTKNYEYKAIDVDGTMISLSSMGVTSSSQYKEIDSDSTGFSGSNFVIHINQYRYGSGSFEIGITVSSIVLDGETFETNLKVSQSIPSPPECVAVGGTYEVSGGQVAIPMYNLGSPPRSAVVTEVKLSIGSSSYLWSSGDSDLTPPDQTVVFSVSSSGSAKITCDGEEAVVIGDSIEITGASGTPASTPTNPSPADLAEDLITAGPDEVENYSLLTAKVRVVASSVESLTKSEATPIINMFCSVISALNDDCALIGLTAGSAIMELSGNVPEGSDAETELETSFENCSFQSDLNYECKGELELVDVQTKAAAGGAITAGTGLALWTIILIAGLGAFALITLIMLGLLAVYRRSAEQSESGYSSSGPLGVPDPSDLLYEQSIVRDIYGRGDFPDGGPSAQVAEQRQREANLREEFPRPPTSTSLSRDDASSTYTL